MMYSRMADGLFKTISVFDHNILGLTKNFPDNKSGLSAKLDIEEVSDTIFANI